MNLTVVCSKNLSHILESIFALLPLGCFVTTSIFFICFQSTPDDINLNKLSGGSKKSGKHQKTLHELGVNDCNLSHSGKQAKKKPLAVVGEKGNELKGLSAQAMHGNTTTFYQETDDYIWCLACTNFEKEIEKQKEQQTLKRLY
jgi:hypothetical protein